MRRVGSMLLPGLVSLGWLSCRAAAAEEPSPEAAPAAPAETPAPTAAAHPWVLQVAFVLPNLEVELADEDADLAQNYRTNTPMTLSLGASYEGLGASIGFGVGDPVDDPDDYGETRALDYQVHYYRGRFGVDAFYQDYEGYALETLPAGCRRGDACSLAPDLRLRHIGVTGFFVLDPAYSLKAAFEAAERARRHAGSWLLTAGVNHVRLDAPDPLVLSPDVPPLRRVESTMATVGGGYGQLWVWDSWYLSPVLMVAGGYGRSTFTPAETPDSHDAALRVNIRLGGGYNAPTWFTGLTAVMESPIVERDLSLQFFAGEVRMFGGVRL
ncbi:DUF4421 domain-containing protein [Myxococcota bacterium]|nr:DUF4421 domain-containing protein [Myxococcota bacterium]